MNSYLIGETVTLTHTVMVAGVLTDASPVTVRVDRPDGVIDGPFTMNRASLGTYTYAYKPAVAAVSVGKYTARATSTSPESVGIDEFFFLPSPFI